jgi:hypothetical protein
MVGSGDSLVTSGCEDGIISKKIVHRNQFEARVPLLLLQRGLGEHIMPLGGQRL